MFLYSDSIKLGSDFVTCSYALQCISDSIKLGPDFVTCSYALQCISDSIKLGPDFVTCSNDLQCISKKEDSLKLIRYLYRNLRTSWWSSIASNSCACRLRICKDRKWSEHITAQNTESRFTDPHGYSEDDQLRGRQWKGSVWSFVFSSPPQRPMTSDFEGFSIPGLIHYIIFVS